MKTTLQSKTNQSYHSSSETQSPAPTPSLSLPNIFNSQSEPIDLVQDVKKENAKSKPAVTNSSSSPEVIQQDELKQSQNDIDIDMSQAISSTEPDQFFQALKQYTNDDKLVTVIEKEFQMLKRDKKISINSNKKELLNMVLDYFKEIYNYIEEFEYSLEEVKQVKSLFLSKFKANDVGTVAAIKNSKMEFPRGEYVAELFTDITNKLIFYKKYRNTMLKAKVDAVNELITKKHIPSLDKLLSDILVKSKHIKFKIKKKEDSIAKNTKKLNKILFSTKQTSLDINLDKLFNDIILNDKVNELLFIQRKHQLNTLFKDKEELAELQNKDKTYVLFIIKVYKTFSNIFRTKLTLLYTESQQHVQKFKDYFNENIIEQINSLKQQVIRYVTIIQIRKIDSQRKVNKFEEDKERHMYLYGTDQLQNQLNAIIDNIKDYKRVIAKNEISLNEVGDMMILLVKTLINQDKQDLFVKIITERNAKEAVLVSKENCKELYDKNSREEQIFQAIYDFLFSTVAEINDTDSNFFRICRNLSAFINYCEPITLESKSLIIKPRPYSSAAIKRKRKDSEKDEYGTEMINEAVLDIMKEMKQKREANQQLLQADHLQLEDSLPTQEVLYQNKKKKRRKHTSKNTEVEGSCVLY